jgi:hypothetical protein
MFFMVHLGSFELLEHDKMKLNETKWNRMKWNGE